MQAAVETYKFTVGEYMNIYEAGIFDDDDRKRELPLYARFGVPEFLLVNLVDDVIETFRNFDGTTYRDVCIWRRGERVAPEAFPDVFIDVDDTIPEHFEELYL